MEAPDKPRNPMNKQALFLTPQFALSHEFNCLLVFNKVFRGFMSNFAEIYLISTVMHLATYILLMLQEATFTLFW